MIFFSHALKNFVRFRFLDFYALIFARTCDCDKRQQDMT